MTLEGATAPPPHIIGAPPDIRQWFCTPRFRHGGALVGYPARRYPSTGAMPESLRLRRLIELCLVFLAFLLPGYVSAPPRDPEALRASALLASTLVSALPQIGLLLFLLFVQGEIGRSELGLKRLEAREAPAAALSFLAMIAVLAVLQIVTAQLGQDTREALTRGTRFRLQSASEVPAAAVFCLIAAAREELFYRAYLLLRLRDLGLGLAASVAASTLLFAAAHAYQGPFAVALALVEGLILAGVFLRRRSIWVAVAPHAAYNLAALIATLVPGLTP